MQDKNGNIAKHGSFYRPWFYPVNACSRLFDSHFVFLAAVVAAVFVYRRRSMNDGVRRGEGRPSCVEHLAFEGRRARLKLVAARGAMHETRRATHIEH